MPEFVPAYMITTINMRINWIMFLDSGSDRESDLVLMMFHRGAKLKEL